MRLMQMLLSQSEAGAETYFEKVAAAFAHDASIEQRLIIEEQPSRERRLTSAGVDYRTLPMDRFGKTFLYNWRLRREARHFSPDLIFTWVNRASRKCPDTGAVVVGRLGGYYDIKNYTKCDHLIVNTPDLVRHVVENGWPEQKVSMISNFGECPEALEVPDPLPVLPDSCRVLLTMGRLHPKKAQDTLIRAMPLISNAVLLIAGSGDLRQELEQLAKDTGVADRVHFLGLRKDIRNLYNRADICVFPSRFEPLGNVVLEAWATDTPIVAAASTGPAWLITHEKNGLLFGVDDVEQCAREVNRVLDDPALAEKLVQNGRAEFRERFSKDVIIGQYKKLFEQLLETRGRK